MSKDQERDKFARFNLLTSEASYASQTSQDPNTARRLLGLVPAISGDISREPRHAKYPSAGVSVLPAAVVWTHQFYRNNGSGVFTLHNFVLTSANLLYTESGGAWSQVTAVGTLAGVPMAVNIQNMMHLWDGTTNWLFDGTNWVKEGFVIPLSAPALDTTTAGTLDVASNRFYWFTWADETAPAGGGRIHESTNSVRSAGTGALTSKKIKVRQQAGTATATVSSTAISRTREDFLAQHVGMKFYINGLDFGLINSVVAGTKAQTTLTSTGAFGAAETVVLGGKTYTFRAALTPAANEVLIGGSQTESHRNLKAAVNGEAGAGTLYASGTAQNPDVECTTATGTTNVFRARYSGTAGNSIVSTETCANASFPGATFNSGTAGTDSTGVLATAAPSNQSAQLFLIAPPRATHWHIYASEGEASNVGLYLASKAVTTMEHEDESPLPGVAGSTYTTTIERPTRNDPPPASNIAVVHKNRIFGRLKTFKNFLFFSAFEEVKDEANGAAEESYCGADDNTRSDIVNVYSFPDESDEIRGYCSHGDAIYIGTEDEVLPLYFIDYTQLAISEVTSFQTGLAGRFAITSTPHGLAWVTYDKKVVLYPSTAPPLNEDVTSALVEIGLSIRNKLKLIKSSDLDNVRLKFYYNGDRNWLVLAFKDTSDVYHTWVYDFDIQGWFELSRGVAALDVWEPQTGVKVLVGGGTDGFLYVLDDPSGTYTGTGNFAAGVLKSALIDFGDATIDHLFRYLEFEASSEELGNDITVTYWFDPADVDSPGAGTTLSMSRINDANLYRGFPQLGGVCTRLLVQLDVAASANNGRLRGIVMAAEPVARLRTF